MNDVSWRARLRLLSLALVAVAAAGCESLGGSQPLQEGFVDGIYVPRRRAPEEGAAARFEGEKPGVREVAPGRYEVRIHAYTGVLAPREIRVPVGAEVTFRARSLQSNHGFALQGTGIVLPLWWNRVAEATHTFTEPGEYPFVCSEYCGDGHSSMVGKVIVE